MTANDSLWALEEKLGWALRSVQRMREAADRGDHVAVQDDFWSFLHAVHQFWTYFARWANSERANEKPSTLIESLKTNVLSSVERATWDRLSTMRNEDVHVQ